ncbi:MULTISPECIES: DUF7557 family protein [Halomicrobium]|uniref:Uncharacterized protein n=2 Tax=Halomicrobium mukohataei TaxID=57705 RepID=C7P471_HALMD|nr:MULTISPECIES: antitoxin VapB family protein [Halomicrobium]ACV47893.1 conserved hypothetical protein [Halomicrobium mukohataei DSM 12286]QCD66332.1 hypothetical protein E5139_12015 [Halomicrobium mukohataei]QFR21138.1 hypothetical protein GBQ70_12015 [Halomicrobium sp. ZPS1]
MATADEQIRVSERIKERLEHRRREGESYNDVLERLIADTTESDFDDGFGVLSEEQGEWIRTKRAKARDERADRAERLGDR